MCEFIFVFQAFLCNTCEPGDTCFVICSSVGHFHYSHTQDRQLAYIMLASYFTFSVPTQKQIWTNMFAVTFSDTADRPLANCPFYIQRVANGAGWCWRRQGGCCLFSMQLVAMGSNSASSQNAMQLAEARRQCCHLQSRRTSSSTERLSHERWVLTSTCIRLFVGPFLFIPLLLLKLDISFGNIVCLSILCCIYLTASTLVS